VPAPTQAIATPAPTPGLVVWGRLLRLPNLFMVPGDPVAGFALTGGPALLTDAAALLRLGGAAAGVLGLYMSGLLLNDFFDREEDARERPARPIPSGAVRPATVLVVGLALLAAAVGLVFAVAGRPAGGFAAAVGLTALAYNMGLKRTPVVGPVVMGLCRGGGVLVGASASGSSLPGVVWLAAGVLVCYIVAVTLTAADETQAEPPPPGQLLLPGVFLLAGGTAGCCWLGWALTAAGLAVPAQAIAAGMLVFVIAAGEALVAARRVTARLLPVPPFIGRLIRIMITFQAGWVLLGWGAAGFWPVVLILAGFALLRLGAEGVGRRFYGS